MNESCPFCNMEIAKATLIKEYNYWNLFVQSEEKRAETKLAAGFLASKRHFIEPVGANPDEWAELQLTVKDASKTLCAEVGAIYLDQETVGFNQGREAGQTVLHAHIHVLPVTSEDPSELKVRGGIGGAFEALRKERLKK